MRYLGNGSLITYMRLPPRIISCTYTTMAIRISYASTNLPARGLTLRTSSLVVQHVWNIMMAQMWFNKTQGPIGYYEKL